MAVACMCQWCTLVPACTVLQPCAPQGLKARQESQAELLGAGHMHVPPVVPLGVCVAAAADNKPLGGGHGLVTMLHVLPAVCLLLATKWAEHEACKRMQLLWALLCGALAWHPGSAGSGRGNSGACSYPAASCAWSAGHGRGNPMHGLPH
jgi:hypothetical protein